MQAEPMSDTFLVADVVVARDAVVAAHPGSWTWNWRRPSQPDTEHLIEYDSASSRWVRGTRTRPGGWVDYLLRDWPPVDTREDAEELVTKQIAREAQ
jgi:hypothetical protein